MCSQSDVRTGFVGEVFSNPMRQLSLTLGDAIIIQYMKCARFFVCVYFVFY